MDTRVGVVIPSYNHERFVGDAVRSVLGQSIDDIELVVIDDGSSDGSVAAVRDAASEFPGRSVRVIEQENRGAHAAITRGLGELDTPVLAVLNSDDVYEDDRFERVLPAMEGRGHAIAFTGLKVIGHDGALLPSSSDWAKWYTSARRAAMEEPTIGFGLLVQNFSVTSGNFVFTRGLFERLGGFGEQRFVHDWDFLIRATALAEPAFVDEELMRYRVHGANTTESVRGRLRTECEAALARYAGALAESGDDRNPLAPCGSGWPSYWERFGDRRVFFAPERASRDHGWFEVLARA